MFANDLDPMGSYETPEARLAYLTEQVQIIGIAAQQAKARGDDVDLANLLALFRKVSQDAWDLRYRVSDSERPSDFMLTLSGFSDFAIATVKRIGGAGIDATVAILEALKDFAKGAGGAAAAAPDLLKAIPWLIGAAVVVAGIAFYRGTARVSVRR